MRYDHKSNFSTENAREYINTTARAQTQFPTVNQYINSNDNKKKVLHFNRSSLNNL